MLYQVDHTLDDGAAVEVITFSFLRVTQAPVGHGEHDHFDRLAARTDFRGTWLEGSLAMSAASAASALTVTSPGIAADAGRTVTFTASPSAVKSLRVAPSPLPEGKCIAGVDCRLNFG
jgi:hypothetical protein